MTSAIRKIVVIVLYLCVLILLWLAIKNRYGITTESLKKKEKLKKKKEYLDSSSDDQTSSYTYGTLLRNIPAVNAEARKFMSVRPQKYKDPGGYTLQMPKEFNGIEVWKDYLCPITEQGNCGNCWAHSSTCALADRFAILSLGQVKFIPSPYDPTICGSHYKFSDVEKQWGNTTELQLLDDYFQGRKVDPSNDLQSAACEGAALYTAANILYTQGVTDISCFPGKSALSRSATYDVNKTSVGSSDLLPYCYKLQTLDFDTCVDQKTAMKKYRAKTAYNVGDPEHDNLDALEQAIMQEIYRNGPIVSGFMVFDDFMDPSQFDGKTVYQHLNKSAGSSGGHAIRVVGWGEDVIDGETVPYWWIANSWGTAWGINGYFKFKRKMPECQLEMNAMAMLPDFPGMQITDDNIVPIETQSEIDIRNFTKHYLDPTSGFYTSAMDKISQCKLAGNTTPYADPAFKFPDYKTFYAAEIGLYIQNNPLPSAPAALSPLVTCSTSPTSTPSPAPTSTVTTQDIDNAIDSGAIVPPTPAPSSGGVVQPTTITPSPTPSLSARKVCSMEVPNTYSSVLDKVSKNKIVLDVVFVLLGVGGSFVIWKVLSDEVVVPTHEVESIIATPVVSTPTTPPSPFLAAIPSLSKV